MLTQSPQIGGQSINEMDFPGAMQAVIDGKKVTKLEWGNEEIYLFLFDSHLKIRKADGNSYPLIVSEGDMFGTDWVIVYHE